MVIISVGVTYMTGERVTDYSLMSCTCLFLLYHATIYLHMDAIVWIAFGDWLGFLTSRSSSEHKPMEIVDKIISFGSHYINLGSHVLIVVNWRKRIMSML